MRHLQGTEQHNMHEHAPLILKLVIAEHRLDRATAAAAAGAALLNAVQLACANTCVEDFEGFVSIFVRCFRPGLLPNWWQELTPPSGGG